MFSVRLRRLSQKVFCVVMGAMPTNFVAIEPIIIPIKEPLSDKSVMIGAIGYNEPLTRAFASYLPTIGYRNIVAVSGDMLDLADVGKVRAFFEKYRPQFLFFTMPVYMDKGVFEAKSFDISARFLCGIINVLKLAYFFDVSKIFILFTKEIYCVKTCKQVLFGEINDLKFDDLNGYALSQNVGMLLCQSFRRQFGLNVVMGVVSEIYGPCLPSEMDSHMVLSIIKRIYAAKVAGEQVVRIFFPDDFIEEFLYADECVDACVQAMKKFNGSGLINIASNRSISIAELCQVVARRLDYSGTFCFAQNRIERGFKMHLGLMHDFNWSNKIEPEVGIRKTVDWYVSQISKGVFK